MIDHIYIVILARCLKKKLPHQSFVTLRWSEFLGGSTYGNSGRRVVMFRNLECIFLVHNDYTNQNGGINASKLRRYI
jgi:hypothetical protein